MKYDTAHLITTISHIPWFTHVGQPVTDDIARVASWDEAVRCCRAKEWDSIQFQTRNYISNTVSLKDYDQFCHWNVTVSQVNTEISKVLSTERIANTHLSRCDKAVCDSIAWDLMMACIEIEYCDVVNPVIFLERILPWYQKGHFPCGWDGPCLKPGWDGILPKGQIIVY